VPENFTAILTRFDPVQLRDHETVTLDINVMPGTAWRVDASGPGTLQHEDIQFALRQWVNTVMTGAEWEAAMRGRGTYHVRLRYDCARRAMFDGRIEYVQNYNYVEASGFGSTFREYLPVRNPRVDDIGTAWRLAHEHEEKREKRREKRREERRLYEEAAKKATETLMRMLNADQRRTAREGKFFYIRGSEGNRYRLALNAYSGNVAWVDDNGTARGIFCAHPNMYGLSTDGKSGPLPKNDAVIAQKLMLETDEKAFMKIANIFGGEYPPGVIQRASGANFRACH
jgi:hypothetical protein